MRINQPSVRLAKLELIISSGKQILNTDSREILNKVRKVFERARKEIGVANEKETYNEDWGRFVLSLFHHFTQFCDNL